MTAIQVRIWFPLIALVASASHTAIAQASATTEMSREVLHPILMSSDGSTGALFIHFDSKYGFVYKNIGLPLIGEHYPFHESMPHTIAVEKYGPNESIDSIIIPAHYTKRAGYKVLSGISLQTGKLLWIGFAVLIGCIAALSKNVVAQIVGQNHPALNNLFWYGFGVGFILGLFIDFNAMFGKNRLIYFDNANSEACHIRIDNHRSIAVGPRENMGVYVKVGWNDVDIHPSSGSDNVWHGRILIEKSDGHLVFNVGGHNRYEVKTAVWKKQ